MARPREYDDDLRVQLIDTAGRLLAAEGPHAVSTRRVAAEVGTSTTAIYSLLGSKQELLRAMFNEGFRRLAEHLSAVPASDDPLEHLVALGFAYHESAMASPHLYWVMFDCPVPEFTATDKDVVESLATLQVLIDAVAEAVDQGLLEGNPEDIAVELWAMNHGVTLLAMNGMLGAPKDARSHVERVLRVSIIGYTELSKQARTPRPARSSPV